MRFLKYCHKIGQTISMKRKKATRRKTHKKNTNQTFNFQIYLCFFVFALFIAGILNTCFFFLSNTMQWCCHEYLFLYTGTQRIIQLKSNYCCDHSDASCILVVVVVVSPEWVSAQICDLLPLYGCHRSPKNCDRVRSSSATQFAGQRHGHICRTQALATLTLHTGYININTYFEGWNAENRRRTRSTFMSIYIYFFFAQSMECIDQRNFYCFYICTFCVCRNSMWIL